MDAAAEVRQGLVRMVVAMTALVVLLALIGLAFKAQLLALSSAFVNTLGPMGVALGFFIPDATALPLPHDAFLAFGRIGGLSFGTLVVYASIGSILGGSLAFGAARAVAGTPWFEKRSGAKVLEARRLVERHGIAALALGALTPLPYSLLCWACGGLGMPAGRFFAVSLLRIVRVASYLWLIEKGVVEAVV